MSLQIPFQSPANQTVAPVEIASQSTEWPDNQLGLSSQQLGVDHGTDSTVNQVAAPVEEGKETTPAQPSQKVVQETPPQPTVETPVQEVQQQVAPPAPATEPSAESAQPGQASRLDGDKMDGDNKQEEPESQPGGTNKYSDGTYWKF